MRNLTLALGLTLVMVAGALGAEQPARRQKPATNARQAVDAGSQSQRVDGTHEDQLVAYRFRLFEPGGELLIANPSDQPAVVTVFRGGARLGLEVLRVEVASGSSVAVSDFGDVKASRRVRLSVRLAAGGDSVDIPLHPGAAFYEIFSLERQSEVALDPAARRIEFLSARRAPALRVVDDSLRFSMFSELVKLSANASANAAGDAPASGLFVAHSGK